MTQPLSRGQYRLRVELESPGRAPSLELLSARVSADGSVAVETGHAERLDPSLALLAAVGRVKQGSDAGEPLAGLRSHAVGLPRDHGRAMTASTARMQMAVRSALATLVGSARDVPADGQADADDESEAWQPPRDLVAQRDQILNFGGAPALRAREAQTYLAVTRATLVNWRRRGQILGLPVGSDRKLMYPRWQFDPRRPTRVLEGLTTVVGAHGDEDPWGVAAWLVRRHPALDGARPIEQLREGDAAGVSRLARLLSAEYL